MFRRFFVALLATDPPSVFHRLRQLVQQAPQFHVFFLAQGAANPVLKDFAPLGSHLKGSPAFRGQAHAHHPVVLWVAGSLDPALTLQLLGQPRYTRRIHAVEAADLTLADAGFPGEHVKDEVFGRAYADIPLEGPKYLLEDQPSGDVDRVDLLSDFLMWPVHRRLPLM